MEEMEKKEQSEQEQEQMEEALQEPTPAYVPRPAWQVWGARIALVVFIALVIMYMLNIARGGR